MRARLTYLLVSPRTPRRVARAAGWLADAVYRATTTAALLAAAVTFTLYVVAGAVAQAAGL